jgi:hypothetical protein
MYHPGGGRVGDVGVAEMNCIARATPRGDVLCSWPLDYAWICKGPGKRTARRPPQSLSIPLLDNLVASLFRFL